MDDAQRDATGGAYTVVALFDESVDAERALMALQKANHAADHVSLIVQSKGEPEPGVDQAVAVARSLVATALSAVGSWLQGLASLVLPERGAFLVAGPMGAALASAEARAARPDAIDPSGAGALPEGRAATPAPLAGDRLLRVLTDFGFTGEEATYLEQRLGVGTILVAVTAEQRDALERTRGLFADHDAVYLGTARTDTGFFETAEALLHESVPAGSGGEVVVADAVAPLRRVSEVDEPPADFGQLRGRDVVDPAGQTAGEVDDVVIELVDPDGLAGPEPARYVLRYLVVGHGGVLGLGRSRVAVPAPLVTAEGDRFRVAVDQATLRGAPAFDDDPFSRRDEQATHGYFGLRPYWDEEPAAVELIPT